jgi:hypothetical protein
VSRARPSSRTCAPRTWRSSACAAASTRASGST